MTEKFMAHSFGILYTADGNCSYYLLKDHPIDRYPWQLDNQQMWYVVRREWNSILKLQNPVGCAFQLVTTSPTIEFIPEEIEVETVGLDENDEENELASLGLPLFDDEFVPDMQID